MFSEMSVVDEASLARPSKAPDTVPATAPSTAPETKHLGLASSILIASFVNLDLSLPLAKFDWHGIKELVDYNILRIVDVDVSRISYLGHFVLVARVSIACWVHWLCFVNNCQV